MSYVLYLIYVIANIYSTRNRRALPGCTRNPSIRSVSVLGSRILFESSRFLYPLNFLEIIQFLLGAGIAKKVRYLKEFYADSINRNF